jgi:hypothetical protein
MVILSFEAMQFRWGIVSEKKSLTKNIESFYLLTYYNNTRSRKLSVLRVVFSCILEHVRNEANR